MAILASAALLSASLTAISDCAPLCANTPSMPLRVEAMAMQCARCVPPRPLKNRQTDQRRGGQRPYNCGQHCLRQAIARKVSITTAQISAHVSHELLVVNKSFALDPVIPELAPAQSESHSPPLQSGRSICRHTSLLRI